MKVTNSATGEVTKIQKGKGQVQTEARYKALSCKRMAVQQGVMVETRMGHLPDWYKWNVDASTMILEIDGKGVPMYRVVSCHVANTWEEQLFKNPLTSIRFQEGLDMGLKWMHLCNGNGDFGSMVLIISVPGLPQGRFFCAKVQGLGFDADSTKYGTVYFAASRCMKGLPDNAQATVDEDDRPCNPWSHYFQNVFIDDIKRYADAYATVNPETGEQFESVVTIDGEACVNRELMASDVFEKLSDENIVVIKNRPSGTAYDNANDASDNFRDKNTGLKHAVTHNIDTSNAHLEKGLRDAFKQMRAAYPSVTMTSAHEKQAIIGVSRFTWVCKQKYVSAEKGIIGFRRSCQVRSPGKDLLRSILGHEHSTVDTFRLMKHLCLTKFSEEEFDNIQSHFPEMMHLHRVNGRVTNADMDLLGICKLPEGEHKDRDALCLAQQGPVDLTHHETRQRESVYASRKETAATEKARADAVILVRKHTQKQATIASKDAEKARVKLLTKEQKLSDPACIAKAALALAKKGKKAAKDVAAAAALNAATAAIAITA